MVLNVSWKNHSLNMSMSPFLSESSHSKKANFLTILCPTAAARFSLKSVSADRLMPGLVNRIHSVKYKSVIVFSIGSDSDFSTSTRIPKFHKILEDVLLEIGIQNLEEVFSLHVYEISLII